MIYKILNAADWRHMEETGSFSGSAVDLRDSFIHFSTADQMRETAAKHFAQQSDLKLLAVDASALGGDLKWEPSRGGALFPHLYAVLQRAAVLSVVDLAWDGERHCFPNV